MDTREEMGLDHSHQRARGGTISMVRDVQRQRVYNAEADVPTGGEWRTIPEVQDYVDHLTADEPDA
jgi:hypothetical protein